MNILKFLRLYGAYISLSSLLIFIFPGWFIGYGEIGWMLLLVIMFLKPIYDLCPKFTWLGKILPLRRQLGIICGSFILAHGIGAYMVGYEITPHTFLEPTNFLLWGALGTLVMLPVLATSNNFAVKILKKRWKIVQRLAYFFFIFGVLHIYFIEKELGVLFMLIIWILLKLLAMKKIILLKK